MRSPGHSAGSDTRGRGVERTWGVRGGSPQEGTLPEFRRTVGRGQGRGLSRRRRMENSTAPWVCRLEGQSRAEAGCRGQEGDVACGGEGEDAAPPEAARRHGWAQKACSSVTLLS